MGKRRSKRGKRRRKKSRRKKRNIKGRNERKRRSPRWLKRPQVFDDKQVLIAATTSQYTK